MLCHVATSGGGLQGANLGASRPSRCQPAEAVSPELESYMSDSRSVWTCWFVLSRSTPHSKNGSKRMLDGVLAQVSSAGWQHLQVQVPASRGSTCITLSIRVRFEPSLKWWTPWVIRNTELQAAVHSATVWSLCPMHCCWSMHCCWCAARYRKCLNQPATPITVPFGIRLVLGLKWWTPWVMRITWTVRMPPSDW